MASIARVGPTRQPSCFLSSLPKSQIRPLSTSPSHQAPLGQQTSMVRQMPKQTSMTTRIKKLRRSEIPTDVGLLPNTFIRPCGNMPSWFSHPTMRLRMEWLYLKQSFTDTFTAINTFRWQQGKDPITGRRKKLPLEWRDRHFKVRDLHTELYETLAARDKTRLSEIACSGLANQQTPRMEAARMDKSPGETWTVKYRGAFIPARIPATVQFLIPSMFKAIHVVADRQVMMPVGQGFVIRQIIARVDSTQTLTREDGSEPLTKNEREYVVIQKYFFPEESDEEWKIWGTVKPTDADAAMEIINVSNSGSGSMMEKMRTMMPSFPGMNQ